MKAILTCLLSLLLFMPAAPVVAAIDDYTFADPADEVRFNRLIAELRCPMCLNANLAGSDAPIAADLRTEIREQIEAGRTDAEILSFLKARYGDFITYRPPLNPGTTLLWFGPPVLLLAGFFVVRRMLKASRAAASEGGLSMEERARLREQLEDEGNARS